MELIRNLKKNAIFINDNGKPIVELTFIDDNFVIIIYTDKKVFIPKEIDEDFYNNFSSILTNDYSCESDNCEVSEDELFWLSEDHKYVESEAIDDINRFLLTRQDDGLSLVAANPFHQNHNLEKNYNLISFMKNSSERNNINLETGKTIQEDLIQAFNDTLHQRTKSDTKVRKRGVK